LVAVARVAFRTLLHKPGTDEIAMIDDWAQPLPPLHETQDQLYATALKNRAELQALRTLTEAQDEYLTADSNSEWPKLGIGASADLARPNQAVNPYSEDFDPSWQVFAALTWSPSDYATGSARHGQNEADRATTLADMQIMEDALRREVAQGFEDYLAAGKSFESAETGIKAAAEAYRVRREQFRAGAAVAIDVIDAEAELRQARLQLINAAIDMRIARARLDRAVGRGQ
jgi:outer membrane protein